MTVPYTVEREGRTPAFDWWCLVRRSGGRLVRVTVPKQWDTPEVRAEAIELALQRLPELPGPWTF
jgi:hypothetical protein